MRAKYVLDSDSLRKLKRGLRGEKKSIEISLDLGMTSSEVRLENGRAVLPNGTKVDIPEIDEDDRSCYAVLDSELREVRYFSGKTDLFYKLEPTSKRPVLKVSGTRMHKQEFVDLIKSKRLRGKILDSGTGLGCTAMEAAKTAGKVVTVEMDENVLNLAKQYNPYSQELFQKDNIDIRINEITKEIKNFEDGYFDCVILDGGMPASSEKFFSRENYREVFRVLKSGGESFHYVPRHQVHTGRDFLSEIVSRLKEAGFTKVDRYDEIPHLEFKK